MSGAHLLAAKFWRVGVLAGVEIGPGSSDGDAFLSGLKHYGYIEGKNIIVERRVTRGANERAAALAAELVTGNVDVLVTVGGHAAHAAKQVTPRLFQSSQSLSAITCAPGSPKAANGRAAI